MAPSQACRELCKGRSESLEEIQFLDVFTDDLKHKTEIRKHEILEQRQTRLCVSPKEFSRPSGALEGTIRDRNDQEARGS